MSIASSSAPRGAGSYRRPPKPLPNIIALGAVLLLAPVIAFLVSVSEVGTTAMITAGVFLVLVVLWSAEATFYVLIFSMLLSPELVVGGLPEIGATGTTASRGVTLRYDDFVIAIIALAWLVRLAVFSEAGVLRRNRMSGPILAYIGVCFLSTIVGILFGRVEGLTGIFFALKYFEYVVVFFLVVNYVHSRAQVKRLLYATLVTAAIISVVVITQIPGGERITAPFEGEEGEPNTLGGYLVLMIAMALAFLSEAESANERMLWGGFAGLMMIPLVFTYSRTSWLAFIAMIAMIVILCRRKTLFLTLASLGLIFLVVSPPEAILERASYTITGRPAATGAITVAGVTIEPSAAARLQSWFVAASAVPRQPILGYGITGFSFIDSQYPRTMIETGLLGLAAFAWMLWMLWLSGRELLHLATDRFDRAVAIGFLAALVGTIVHGIGANTFIIVRIMEPFWLLAGFAVILLRINEQENAAAGAAQVADATSEMPDAHLLPDAHNARS